MRFSKSAGTFFPEELDYQSLPDDLITVSEVEYRAAMSRHHLATLDVVNGRLVVCAPSSDALLEQERSVQSSKISQACRTAITGGFQSSALGAEHTYPYTPTDQANLTAAAIAALSASHDSDWSAGLWCANAAGDWVFARHTAAQVRQVQDDGVTTTQERQERHRHLQEKIAKAQTAKAVQAIAWD